MGISELTDLIYLEVKDLKDSVSAFEAEKKKQGGKKPTRGDGAKWGEDPYGTMTCLKEGLQQGATGTGIERKILTIREHLNTLRKLVN